MTELSSQKASGVEMASSYQGHSLPHWVQDNAIYHAVFRLADSLPASKRAEFENERKMLSLQAGLTEADRKRLRYLVSERTQVFLDSGHGSCILAQHWIAELVRDSMFFFHGERYRLHAYCVMPNHVHAVVEPCSGHTLDKILHSWKSFTAHEIKKKIGGSESIWQKEGYDHIVRNDRSYAKLLDYVLKNPPYAGLENWPWVGYGPAE